MKYSAGPHGPTLPGGQHKTMSVSVNDGPYEQVVLPVTETWQQWTETVIGLDLEAGQNSVQVSFLGTDTGWINIDHFVVDSADVGAGSPLDDVSVTAGTRCVVGRTVVTL